MGLEDKYPDVLQNIEFMIVRLYKENGELRDKTVIKALEAAASYYRALATKRPAPEPTLEDLELEVFEQIKLMLENRREENQAIAPKRFSRAFKEPTQDEIFLACIRKIEKSAKRWTKRRGERGYLNFIKDYII